MELVAVVMSGWDLTVRKNVLIATRPVRSALHQTLTSVSSVRMDSPLSMDTVSHVLIVAQPASQPTVPERINVLAATLASDSMPMEDAQLVTQHVLPAPTPGMPLHAHLATKTQPWLPQDTVSVTSLRSVYGPARLVRTTAQVVLYSKPAQENVLMIQENGKIASAYQLKSLSIWTKSYQLSTNSSLTPTKLSTHSMLKVATHLLLSA